MGHNIFFEVFFMYGEFLLKSYAKVKWEREPNASMSFSILLTHFMPLISFRTLKTHQKTRGCWMFSVSRERPVVWNRLISIVVGLWKFQLNIWKMFIFQKANRQTQIYHLLCCMSRTITALLPFQENQPIESVLENNIFKNILKIVGKSLRMDSSLIILEAASQQIY